MLRTAGRPRRIEQCPATGPLVYAVEMAGPQPLEMRVRTHATGRRTCWSSSGGRPGCGRG